MKLNKIICFMLSLIISVSAVFIPTFAEETVRVSEIEFLNELGIVKGYEDGELHPEYNITRMEYAALIIRCLGYEGEYPSLDNVFTDVPKDSWGAAAVQFAYDLGIINGYGDGRFGPDDNILEVDAVKIIVSALGRRLEAEAEGGYPTGYLSIAQDLKLMKDYKGGEEKATRAFVSTLIANALEVAIVEQNFTSNAFMANKGRTILSILGISKYKGILTAVNGTNIASEENVLADEVIISGRTFKTDKVFVPEFAGEEVTAYVYRYGESEEKVLDMYITGEGNRTLTVQSKDILDKTNLIKFAYIEKNKEKEIDLPTGFSITYNGTLLDRSIYITPERLKPINGYVKLIDMNNDKKYDAAFVKEYKTYVVRTVTEDTIYDVYGNSVIFDIDEENSSVVVKKDNKVVSWEDITSGCVLSVAVNTNGTVAEILISNKSVNEKAISTATRDGVPYYGFKNGEQYKTTVEYNTAFTRGYKEAKAIEIGGIYKIRLNVFDEIAYVEEGSTSSEGEESDDPSENAISNTSDEKYGYLTTAALYTQEIDEYVEIKLLTTENKFEIFTIPGGKNIRFGRMVNGVYELSKATPSEIYASLVNMDRTIQRQVVKYVLDTDETIKELYLADERAKSAHLSKDTERILNTFSYNTVSNQYYFNEKTVLFVLTGNGETDYDIICTTPGGYLGNRSSYNSELWDIDSDGFINCICLYPSKGGSPNDSTAVFVIDALNDAVMLVTDVYQENNSEGVLYKIIEGYENGKKVKRILSDSISAVSAIRPGMIIQYQTNKPDLKFAYYAEYDEVVIGYKEMFDVGEIDLKPFVSYNHKDRHAKNAKIMYGYTTVTRVDFPTMTVSANNMKFNLHNGTMVLKYSKNGYIEKLDASQIVEGQKIFFRTRLDNLRDVIVIE